MSVNELLRVLLPNPRANFPSLDTPFSKYSKTNHAAFGQDIHAITEILRQRQAQLDDVAADIATVESIMECARDVHQQFLSKRDQILASVKTHQALISCIRRLPPEMLSEIFVWCLPSETHTQPDTRTAPLLLMAVCKEWRKVALKTPRLWCSLSVRQGHRGQQQDLFLYRHWLERARDCPLSLAVDARESCQNSKWRSKVLELLLPYTSRVARLQIVFDEDTAPTLLLKDVPTLEHLTLEGDLSKLAIIQPETRLRSLTLDKVVFRMGATVLSVFDFNWKHLTQLRVRLASMPLPSRDMDGQIVFTLLALCPHLQYFAFSSVLILRPDVATTHALTHAHLRSLDVVVHHGVGFFLNKLTLPELRHLRIVDSYSTPGTWRHNEFKTFVVRSRCPLETLSIHGGQRVITQEDRMEYAVLIPTLKHLDMDMSLVTHSRERNPNPRDVLRRLGLSD